VDVRRPVATLDEVALTAGVSRATVSRVVNRTRNVAPDIQQAVLKAIAATGYVPNRAARSLRTQQIGSVALVVCSADNGSPDAQRLPRSLTDPYVGRLMGGALAALQALDVRLELLFVDNPDPREALVGRLLRRDVDGVLLVSVHTEDPLPPMVAGTGRPAVLIGHPARPVGMSVVDVEQGAGAGLAAAALLDRGCRSLAVIAGPEKSPGANQRLSGFIDAVTARGGGEVTVASGDLTIHSGERAMIGLLDRRPSVDGVFAANDRMAQGALLALRERGRAVPGEIAVVGFDDGPNATGSRPLLTTVRQPLEEMAAEAVRLLMEQVQAVPPKGRTVLFAPTLVVRESA